MSILTHCRVLITPLILFLITILLILVLTTIRIEHDERGVWAGQVPRIEVIYLPHQAGPALWVYLRGSLVWHIERVRQVLPDAVVPDPAAPPEPVEGPATPTPVRLGPMKLEQA